MQRALRAESHDNSSGILPKRCPVLGGMQLLDSFDQHCQYLDTVLPTGSKVTFFGLVDGRILYEANGERIHPIGALNKNVRYRDFYDYLNCLQVTLFLPDTPTTCSLALVLAG